MDEPAFGGTGHRLDDIELRRNDETYMDALGAQRIPDPTTGEILHGARPHEKIRPVWWKAGSTEGSRSWVGSGAPRAAAGSSGPVAGSSASAPASVLRGSPS